jgi:hypothetical protein
MSGSKIIWMKLYLLIWLSIFVLINGCLGNPENNIILTPAPTENPAQILIISDVSAEASDTSAEITWFTDPINSDSIVRYGTDPGKYTVSLGDREYVSAHKVSLTGLQPGTTYYFRVGSVSVDGMASQSREYMFTTIELPPPVISNVKSFSDSTSSSIRWTTNVRSNSHVNYSSTPANYTFSVLNNEFTTSHEIRIQNLLPGNTYYYKVKSSDELGISSETEELSFETRPVESGEKVVLGDLLVSIFGLEEYFQGNSFYSKAIIELENRGEKTISIDGLSTAILGKDGNQSTKVNLGTAEEFTSLSLLLPKGTISRDLYYERVAEGPGTLFITLFFPSNEYSFKVFVDSPPWTPLNLTVEEEREETKENIEVVLDELTTRWERHASGRSFLYARADFTFTNNGEKPVSLKIKPEPAIIDDEGIQHVYERTGHKDEFEELTLFPGGHISGAFFFSPHIGFHTRDINLILYINGIKYEYLLNVYMR